MSHNQQLFYTCMLAIGNKKITPSGQIFPLQLDVFVAKTIQAMAIQNA